MPENDEKEKIYGAKWEFTFSVREPCPTVNSKHGPIKARRIKMTDRNGNVFIDVSGPPLHAPSFGKIFRTARFSLGPRKGYQAAPEWIVEAIRVAGFSRAEV